MNTITPLEVSKSAAIGCPCDALLEPSLSLLVSWSLIEDSNSNLEPN